VERISARSFRAYELAESSLRDLVKSRIDTTRDVVFQPLGTRFADAAADPARLAVLFREDAFRAQTGHFARLVLRVEPSLADRLATLDAGAVEARLQEATRAALSREMPRAQGVYLVRFEPSVRGTPEPVAHVHLSCRLGDGGPAPALPREQLARFHERWAHELERAFGLHRGPAREIDRDRESPALDPEVARIRQQLARGAARLFAVYAERLAGTATRGDLDRALDQVRRTRAAWLREIGPAVDLRDVGRRQVFDVIRVRIEGGTRYLSGDLEGQRRRVLEDAASRAAGFPEGRDRHVAVVAWPAGPDLHGTVYFNQRSRPERPLQSIDPIRLRVALEERLRDEIQRAATSLDSRVEARADLLGRVDAHVVDLDRDRAATSPERAGQEAADVTGGAIVVAIPREERSEAEHAALAGSGPERDPFAGETPGERDWTSERVFTVRLRIPTGAEQLDRSQFGPDEIATILQRAIDRAYPFLEREGIRGNFLWAAHGKALDVRIVIPEKLGWSHDQLRSPGFQQRFLTGFHQALAQVSPARLMPEREQAMAAVSRGLVAVRTAPALLREGEQDPERAAKRATVTALSRLSDVLPKPFRMMRELGRGVSRLMSRSE
jgi:hypothetical protein